MSTLQIRMATADDAPAIQAIYAPFVRDTVISFELTPPSVDEITQRIAKIGTRLPWLVGVTDAGVVGYAYATQHRERAAYQWAVDVSVYIDPPMQRRGIGRGLYTALFALLRAQGYVHAYAGIALPNPSSIALHTTLGFEPVGVFRQVGYKFETWHDVGWWTLQLTRPAQGPVPPQPITTLIDSPMWHAALEQGLTRSRL